MKIQIDHESGLQVGFTREDHIEHGNRIFEELKEGYSTEPNYGFLNAMQSTRLNIQGLDGCIGFRAAVVYGLGKSSPLLLGLGLEPNISSVYSVVRNDQTKYAYMPHNSADSQIMLHNMEPVNSIFRMPGYFLSYDDGHVLIPREAKSPEGDLERTCKLYGLKEIKPGTYFDFEEDGFSFYTAVAEYAALLGYFRSIGAEDDKAVYLASHMLPAALLSLSRGVECSYDELRLRA